MSHFVSSFMFYMITVDVLVHVSAGVVHNLPIDMKRALLSQKTAWRNWESLTPLARNEWICWVTFVKKDDTRKKHLVRLVEDLQTGKRRPCCWMGCPHRVDKLPNASHKFILGRRKGK